MKIHWIEEGVLAAGEVPVGTLDIQSLHQQGVRAILSLTEAPITRFKEVTPALLSGMDIACFHVPVSDQFPPTHEQAEAIVAILAKMEGEGRPIYVHCHTGVGRTGTVLHLYYLAQGLTLVAARGRVRARRIACILLSDPQQAFLKEYAARLSLPPPDSHPLL